MILAEHALLPGPAALDRCMIDLLPASPPTPAPPSAPASGGDAARGAARGTRGPGFGQTLGAFLDVRDAAADAPVAGPAGPDHTDRQPLAEVGKDLPDTPVDAAPAGPLVWAFAMPVAPLPVPVAASVAAPPVGVAVAPLPATVPPAAIVQLPAMPPLPAAATPPDPTAAAPTTTTVAQAPSDGSSPRATRTDADRSPAAAPAPVVATPPTIAVSAVPQPAHTVFAAAIAAAGRQESRRDDSGTAPAPALTLDALQRPAVQATGATHDAPLDLGQERGLQQMIDRIETLRDDRNAADTRIRLVPDALGAVDIKVRSDGDAVHVHFTAERGATQALLLDAQPRLTELAAARGVRLAETSVSTGGFAQGGGGAAPQPRAPRPTPAAPAAADPIDSPADTRLA